MPEVVYCTELALPPETVWEFVKDMNNWAPFLTGYQKHEILSDTDSIWTLRGDVGILSRTVRLRAHVTEWNGPERVAFTLTGLNEKVDGGGVLTMGEATGRADVPGPPRRGWLRRAVYALVRAFFRYLHGSGPKRLPAPARAAGARSSKLTFCLRMEAGGPTGPLVNAVLGPALQPAAEDLANKIAAHLEGREATPTAVARNGTDELASKVSAGALAAPQPTAPLEATE